MKHKWSLNGIFTLSVLTIILGTSHTCFSKPIIVLYLTPPPAHIVKEAQTAAKALLKAPTPAPVEASLKLSNNAAAVAGSYEHATLGGFPVLYQGYLDYSNSDGQIAFPLSHENAALVRLLITPSVELAQLKNQTYNYTKISPSAKTQSVLYRFELKPESHTTEGSAVANQYWEIRKEEINPQGGIDKDTLVILASSNGFFVEEGDRMAVKGANVVLPPVVHVLHGAQLSIPSLVANLGLFRFFEHINLNLDISAPTATRSVITNQNY